MRAGLSWLVLALALPLRAGAQTPSLRPAAEAARQHWLHQDPEQLVQGSQGLRLQLPGADPSGTLDRRQAAALLRDFVQNTEEVGVDIQDARQVGDDRGFVELLRHYRVKGTQEIKEQSLFLSYAREGEGWMLTELRVAGREH